MTGEDDIVRLEDIRSSRLRVIESHLSEIVEREEKVVERLEDAGQEFDDETLLWSVTNHDHESCLVKVRSELRDRGELEP